MNSHDFLLDLMSAVAGFSCGLLSPTALNAALAVNECKMNYFPQWIEKRRLLAEISVLMVVAIIGIVNASPILAIALLISFLHLDSTTLEPLNLVLLLVSLVGGIGIGMLIMRFRLQRADPIQDALNDQRGRFPILMEVVDRLGRNSSEGGFEKAIKNRDVRNLRCRFRCVRIERSRQMHVVTKYGLEAFETPFVVFFEKGGRKLPMDGKILFSGEDIATPERCASLLKRALDATAAQGLERA